MWITRHRRQAQTEREFSNVASFEVRRMSGAFLFTGLDDGLDEFHVVHVECTEGLVGLDFRWMNPMVTVRSRSAT